MGEKELELVGNTFAFFTRNPRGGKAKDIDPEDAEKLLKLIKANTVQVLQNLQTFLMKKLML